MVSRDDATRRVDLALASIGVPQGMQSPPPDADSWFHRAAILRDAEAGACASDAESAGTPQRPSSRATPSRRADGTPSPLVPSAAGQARAPLYAADIEQPRTLRQGQPLVRIRRIFAHEAAEPLLAASEEHGSAASDGGGGGGSPRAIPRRNTWGHESLQPQRGLKGRVGGGVRAALMLNNIRLVQELREARQATHGTPPEPSASPEPCGDILLWLCASSLFAFDIFSRLQLNVIMPQLLADYATDETTLSGALGSAWLLAYACAQLPVGLLYDSAGPHRVLSLSAALCAAGGLLFASARTVPLACAGRVLNGVGCGGGFLGVVVAASTFRPENVGLVLGVASVCGFGLGAFGAGTPFKALVGSAGWRAATAMGAALPAAICLALLPSALRSSCCRGRRVPPAERLASPPGGKAPARPSGLALIRAAAAQPNVWLCGLLGGGLDAQASTLFGLLGFSLLTQADGWPPARAALAMSLVALPVGLANFAGSAACSWVRSRAARFGLVACHGLLGLGGLLLLALPGAGAGGAWAGLAMVSLSIGGEGTLWVVIAEAIADEGNGGAVGGLVNALTMLVDALAQPACAYMLGRRRGARAAGGGTGAAMAAPYEPLDLQLGLAPLALLYVGVVVCAAAVALRARRAE